MHGGLARSRFATRLYLHDQRSRSRVLAELGLKAGRPNMVLLLRRRARRDKARMGEEDAQEFHGDIKDI